MSACVMTRSQHGQPKPDLRQGAKLTFSILGVPRSAVAWSDDRVIGDDKKLPLVGNTLDVETATYRNSIGSPFLEAFWEDLDFDPSQRAFYYVRVLEIPTPRWTTFDALMFGVERPIHLKPWQQERAYSPPIWVTPR